MQEHSNTGWFNTVEVSLILNWCRASFEIVKNYLNNELLQLKTKGAFV